MQFCWCLQKKTAHNFVGCFILTVYNKTVCRGDEQPQPTAMFPFWYLVYGMPLVRFVLIRASGTHGQTFGAGIFAPTLAPAISLNGCAAGWLTRRGRKQALLGMVCTHRPIHPSPAASSLTSWSALAPSAFVRLDDQVPPISGMDGRGCLRGCRALRLMFIIPLPLLCG